ncbi:YqzE family protein [Fictibacillus fluitans]|uniref:YqzE family protein n=1 Tax=Fictibacillus fluitans TaxID=3058422 RepID=A0ABT8HWY6_9BACL|nr:YqzE family protein [Fictibacillus sp. NE201]MDN4525299.1 YqzE family protein [Fictibacillus sp. NE201]
MNAYFKFLIESFVKRLSRTQEEKVYMKQQKAERKQPVLVALFGMLPFSLGMVFKKNKK